MTTRASTVHLSSVALLLALGGAVGCGPSSDVASGTTTQPDGGDDWCSTVAMDLVLPATLARGQEFTATQPPGPDWVGQQLAFVDPASCRPVFTTEHDGRRLVVHEVPRGDYSSLSALGPPGTVRGLVPDQIDPGPWLVCGDTSCAATTVE